MQGLIRVRRNPGLVSTLLLPRLHRKKLQSRIVRYGGLDLYLAVLLKNYGDRVGGIKNRRERTRYQQGDLDLEAFRFRPSNPVWLTLGLVAREAGVSRCWMFVFLFLQDLRNNKRQTVTTLLNEFCKRFVYTEILDSVHLIWKRRLREKPA